ncbi:MAG TPA: hypothetical protein VJ966_17435 [Actinomycetes bacterium]|nr:hypothetical protein [Actinomycetes bacterium]
MALFFLLLALLGGAVVGDLIWENTDAGEMTLLDRTLVSYPQGWLLAAAAGIGFVTALLLVASVSSTRARRDRRRQLRAMKRDAQDPGFEPGHGDWLEERLDSNGTAAGANRPRHRQAEPLYEQTREAHHYDDRGQR